LEEKVNNLAGIQVQFNQFLECYIIEKKEQIDKEKNSEKQEILQEELKNLLEIQREQYQAQTQIPLKK